MIWMCWTEEIPNTFVFQYIFILLFFFKRNVLSQFSVDFLYLPMLNLRYVRRYRKLKKWIGASLLFMPEGEQ